MYSKYSYKKTLVLFSVFLFLITIDFILNFFGVALSLFYELPIWSFFLPLCLWECIFLGQNILDEQSNPNCYYLVQLLCGITLFMLFYPKYIVIWSVCVMLICCTKIKILEKKIDKTIIG